jgi:hypothetical protein
MLMNTRRALTLEEFCEPVAVVRDYQPYPRWNTFPHHWHRGVIRAHLKAQPYFREFEAEQPNLNRRLMRGIFALPDLSSQALAPAREDLYQAYLLIREKVPNDQAIGVQRFDLER